MGAIPFRTIAASDQIRTHTNAIEYDSSRAVQGAGRRHKILVMGIKLSAGTLAELVPQRCYSGDQADALWGVGSQLAEMIRSAKKANDVTELWGIGIDPLSGGTAGTKTITVTVTTALAGTIHLYIEGLYYVPVAVAAGAVQNDIATAIDTAIKAHGQYGRMAFTSSVATNVVTLTMKWKGVEVPDARVNYNDGDALPGGVSVAIANAVAGAGNPNIASIITAIAADQYDTIVCPWTDATNMTAFKTELLRRWNGQVKKWTHGFISTAETHANSNTTGNAHNSPHLTYMPANLSPSASWRWAAVTGALNALQSNVALPNVGFFMPDCMAPARSAVWIESERNTLYFEGCSGYVVDSSRQVYTERLTTTYKATALGTDDWAFLDIEKPRTLAAIMYDLDSSVALTFPRHLLMNDGGDIPANLPVVTPKRMDAHIIKRWGVWRDNGWVDASSFAQFKSVLLTLRPDSSRTRLESDLGPALSDQFRGLSAKVAFF